MSIKERLLKLPEEIEAKKFEVMAKQKDLATCREQLRFWELYELSSISNEIDDNGKPKYSNDTKRQAELQHRKDQSEDFGAMEDTVKKLDLEVSVLNIKLDTLSNEQSNLRAICRLESDSND